MSVVERVILFNLQSRVLVHEEFCGAGKSAWTAQILQLLLPQLVEAGASVLVVWDRTVVFAKIDAIVFVAVGGPDTDELTLLDFLRCFSSCVREVSGKVIREDTVWNSYAKICVMLKEMLSDRGEIVLVNAAEVRKSVK